MHASARAVVRERAMDLAERGGGRGLEREFPEPGAPVGPELGRHAAAHERCAHGRCCGLQLGELGGILLGQGFGDGREQLGDLHQGSLQPAERGAQLLGVLRPVDLDAEETLAGHARGEPAHGPGHPGVAPHPAGERILRAPHRTLGHGQVASSAAS